MTTPGFETVLQALGYVSEIKDNNYVYRPFVRMIEDDLTGHSFDVSYCFNPAVGAGMFMAVYNEITLRTDMVALSDKAEFKAFERRIINAMAILGAG